MKTTSRCVFLLFLMAVGCARIALPPGLPPDKQAPVARIVEPGPGATGLAGRPTIQIEFDEYMDRASVQRALIFNPRWAGKLESNWSGRTLRLRPDQDLPPGRTWTLELGQGARDLAGNALDQPLILPLSTGAKLDTFYLKLRAAVGGRQALEGLEFWLWPLSDRPQRRFGQAPWRCTPDSTGLAVAKGLGAGPWFALAVKDLNHDGWWQASTEEAALCSRMLLTPDSLGEDPSLFRLADLAAPDTISLESARFLDRERIQLSAWLEAPQLAGMVDSLRRGWAGDSVRLGLLELRNSLGKRVPLSSLELVEGQWLLSLGAATDSLAHTLALRSGVDSLQLGPPSAAFSASLVDGQALGREWSTGKRVIHSALAAECTPALARQVVGMDTLMLPIRRLSPQTFECLPRAEGASILLKRGFLRAGERQWPDSSLRLQVPATPAGPAPAVLGGIQWKASRLPKGQSWILVAQAENGVRQTALQREGLLDALAPGNWSLALFQDRNGDGRWSPGRLGHELAEPWIQLPGTVEVLPGWVQSEVPLKLPEWLP